MQLLCRTLTKLQLESVKICLDNVIIRSLRTSNSLTASYLRPTTYLPTTMPHHFQQPLLRSTSTFSLLKCSRVFGFPHGRRRFSSSAPQRLADTRVPSRWLADLKARIGKCLIFGLQPTQVDEAGKILAVIARDWRELLAGSEGFLVGQGRAGLERHDVVWGEMVGGSHMR